MQEIPAKTDRIVEDRQVIRKLFEGVEAGRFSGSLGNQAALTLSSLLNPLIWGEEKAEKREELLKIARDLTGVALQEPSQEPPRESQEKVSYPPASWGNDLGPT